MCWNCSAAAPGAADGKAEDDVAADGHAVLAEPLAPPREMVSAQPARTCSECGSARVIPDLTIADAGQYAAGTVGVVVYGNPDALFFRKPLRGELRAHICGDCGHVELRVANPGDLFERYRRSLE
jgi:hypothetical protein